MNKVGFAFPESLLDRETEAYISGHEELRTQVQKEVVARESAIAERVANENPFKAECRLVKEIEAKKSSEVAEILPNIEKEYKTIVNESKIEFDFYKTEFEKSAIIKDEENRKNKEEAVARTLVKDMQQHLLERKTAWEMRLIEELRKEYLKKLLEQIEHFKKLERLLSPFMGRTGLLWDMSSGLFQDNGFEILETYADLLERDESLQELARTLGRHARAQREYEKELIEKTVINTEWKPRPALKGQIAGLCTSNDISSVLPSELALFRNPATKKLFEKKFAEKSLLSFKYENEMPQEKTETVLEEVSKEKEEPKGPIIICVDTSGSMNGTPENIAKTVTFALSKIAIEEKRKCFLISFSTRIECLDLSDFKKGALEKLIQFLRMSFHGGTDATPALKYSINLLQEKDWQNADVLMVSDFVMNNLAKETEQSMEDQKAKKTKFYSLVIGRSGNVNALQCFNHNWSYNIYDTNASRKLVERLRTISAKAEMGDN
ncbi:MAG: VWA domain-containing protein [Salinivirgaceae bacterium]|nr:VWA domain-containing protein [Salinivirgaceae bacterium]